MSKIKIVFIGSGPVSAESLTFLANEFVIEAVITKKSPDYHKGSSPVFDSAKNFGLPVYTANTKNELDDLLVGLSFRSSLAVLIDYGVIVSQRAIDKFPSGIINSHFSLLPEWRGADPITYALLSGQKHTGVSLMLLTEGMDEGPIIAQEKIEISEQDTGVSLTKKLIALSNTLLKENLARYVSGKIMPLDQLEYAKKQSLLSLPSYSKKISKSDGKIDWREPAENIERKVRAFQPWPRSFATIGDNLIVSIIDARIAKDITLKPGEISTKDNRLLVGTGSYALEINHLQPANKKPMSSDEFLRGYLNKLFVQIN